jgi:chromate reductase, NAD(P)H dehydrogenase (quinone)
MPHTPKILAFAGSTRIKSFNRKLVKIAAAGARLAGAEVTEIDLREFEMPLYDGDLEERDGIPPGARRFKRLMIEHDGFLISSPEYNSSISGVLKNAIDWASRPEPNEPQLVAFRGKCAALLSASPGGFGGMRGLVTVRSILSNILVMVLPNQLCISRAMDAFDEAGNLKDPKQHQSAERIGRELSETISKLKS